MITESAPAPSSESRDRVNLLTDTLLPEVKSFWLPATENLDPQIWNLPDPRHKPALDAALGFLESRFDREFLELACIEAVRFPGLMGLENRGRGTPTHYCQLTCFHAAVTYFGEASQPILEEALLHPRDFRSDVTNLVDQISGAEALHYPGCSDEEYRVIADAMEFPPATLPAILPFLRRVANGEFKPHESQTHAVRINRVFAVLHALGEFTYEHYKAAAMIPEYARSIKGKYLDPGAMEERRRRHFEHLAGGTSKEEKPVSPNALIAGQEAFEQTCNEYALQFVREFAPTLDTENFEPMEKFRDYPGAEFLMEACTAIERIGLTKKDFKTVSSDKVQYVITRMSSITRLTDDDDPKQVVEKLRQFKPETLESILYYGGAARELMVAALGWEENKVFQFHEFLGAQVKKYGSSDSLTDTFENGTDPTNGILPRHEFIEAAEGLKPAERKAQIKNLLFPGIGGTKNAKFLFSAIFGDNEKQVRDSLKRFSQPAAKALGLLPLPEDAEEAAAETEARYLALLEFQKGCKKFGSERQANSRAATQVGMENLAANAGFGDAERLSWAMEARIGGGGDDGVPEMQRIDIGDYTVVLQIESGKPSLFVEKKGKALKSIPAPVRKTDDYKQLRETANHLKAQYTRFRNRLEEMMSRAEELSASDLETMVKLPTLRFLLTGLLLRSNDGSYGTYDPDSGKLMGIGGKDAKAKGPFVIAHPHHLHIDGVLSDWQRELVHRRFVQPFKQVFRELYIVTPAEEKSETSSARFSGRTLTAAVAARLFQSRGWLHQHDHEVMVHKVFRNEGIVAVVDTPDVGHFLTELDTFETGPLVFYSFPIASYVRNEPISLTSIPPTIFSEVLRDVDLAASVAYVGDGYWTSSQTRVRRRDLLDAIVADFALQGVSTDGKYAEVKGTLASYRVHLDTGAIYIGGSNHICVVPDRSMALQNDIYLPFAAEDDPKLREIVSRILMLLNDDKIRDKTILAQIKAVF